MNYKKTLITTSIIAILSSITQANEYLSIISQEKNIYDIVENSLPISTEWIDKGSEFDCVKEFNLYDYPLGQTFTQNENCLQKQERTVTTTETFNGILRTTIKTENQNIPVVISYLETGLENFDTGTNETSYSSWLDNGVHYACTPWTPNANTVNFGESFTQNRDCSQNQDRTKTIQSLWADGSKSLDSNTIENRVLTEIESNLNTGTLLFNSCKEILDNNKSIGSGIYNINYNSNTKSVYCEMERDGGGWTLVRRIVGNWNSFNDSLFGTQQVGTYQADPLHNSTFGIVFNNVNYNDMLLTTGNKQKWLITDKDSVQNNWTSTASCGVQSIVYKSSTNPDGPLQSVGWCKRTPNIEDPWISIESHGHLGRSSLGDDIEHSMLYGENYAGWNYYVSSLNGVSIYIR